MRKDFIINIVGTQYVDGEMDKVEIMTLGHYAVKNGTRYIMYKEYPEENKQSEKTTIVKVESENKVSIIRAGEYQSRLLLEKGRRHQCHYRTLAGDLMIGVFTESIAADLHDDGGRLDVSYSLDFNADFASKNEFHIDIKRANAALEL